MNQPYRSGDFCKHIDCQRLKIKISPEELKGLCREYCLAYKFHQYLREHDQILEEPPKQYRKFNIRESLRVGRPIDAKADFKSRNPRWLTGLFRGN